ncbi:hypothetical protein HK104_007411, partial [Borealophlyctis nickersoniae]
MVALVGAAFVAKRRRQRAAGVGQRLLQTRDAGGSDTSLPWLRNVRPAMPRRSVSFNSNAGGDASDGYRGVLVPGFTGRPERKRSMKERLGFKTNGSGGSGKSGKSGKTVGSGSAMSLAVKSGGDDMYAGAGAAGAAGGSGSQGGGGFAALNRTG